MLYTVVVILIVLWLIGLLAHIAGAFIHILLVIALLMLAYNLITKRQKV